MIRKLLDKILIVAEMDHRGHYDIDGVSQYPDLTVIVASSALPGHTYQSCLDHYLLNLKVPLLQHSVSNLVHVPRVTRNV